MEKVKQQINEIPTLLKLIIGFVGGVGILVIIPNLFGGVLGFTEFASKVCTLGTLLIYCKVFYKVFK